MGLGLEHVGLRVGAQRLKFGKSRLGLMGAGEEGGEGEGGWRERGGGKEARGAQISPSQALTKALVRP